MWTWEDIKELGGAIVLAVTIVLVAVTLTATIVYPVLWAGCAQTASAMDTNYHWNVFGGCFLELDGQMIPKSQWSYIKFDALVIYDE